MATKSVKPRSAARPRRPSTITVEWTPEQRQQISERAYQFFLERGGQHGYHMEDWVRAEAEIGVALNGTKARRAKAAS